MSNKVQEKNIRIVEIRGDKENYNIRRNDRYIETFSRAELRSLQKAIKEILKRG